MAGGAESSANRLIANALAFHGLSRSGRNWPARSGVLFAVRPPKMKRLLAVCLIGAAFAAAATPARADRDAVQFFSNIRVAPDATVHDAVCFFCNADVEGKRKETLWSSSGTSTSLAKPITTW